MNGISVLMQWEDGSPKPGRRVSPKADLDGNLILDFQHPELRNKSLLFISQPVCGSYSSLD